MATSWLRANRNRDKKQSLITVKVVMEYLFKYILAVGLSLFKLSACVWHLFRHVNKTWVKNYQGIYLCLLMSVQHTKPEVYRTLAELTELKPCQHYKHISYRPLNKYSKQTFKHILTCTHPLWIITKMLFIFENSNIFDQTKTFQMWIIDTHTNGVLWGWKRFSFFMQVFNRLQSK